MLQGITLTGGEPFLQPVPALKLAREARYFKLDVWCYTGYTFEEILELGDRYTALLEKIDVLVDGPFKIEERTLDLPWRGSRNQRVIDVRKSLDTDEVVLWEPKEAAKEWKL